MESRLRLSIRRRGGMRSWDARRGQCVVQGPIDAIISARVQVAFMETRGDGRASTMETTMRVWIGAVAIAGLVVLGGSAANAQQGDDCREVVRASASVPGTGPIAKVRARERAISSWRQRVAARHGGRFTTWLKAHQRTVDCNPMGTRTRCTAEAFPCRKW